MTIACRQAFAVLYVGSAGFASVSVVGAFTVVCCTSFAFLCPYAPPRPSLPPVSHCPHGESLREGGRVRAREREHRMEPARRMLLGSEGRSDRETETERDRGRGATEGDGGQTGSRRPWRHQREQDAGTSRECVGARSAAPRGRAARQNNPERYSRRGPAPRKRSAPRSALARSGPRTSVPCGVEHRIPKGFTTYGGSL